MAADRYLKGILTIIAIELGWLAVAQSGIAVRAQAPPSAQAQQTPPTPVVITGIDMRDQSFLPVGVLGQVRNVPARLTASFQPVRIEAPQPLDVRTVTTVRVDAVRPFKIESDRPLKVENVGYVPAQRPGE